MSRDTISSNNGSDVLAGLPRTRPQRPSSRRGGIVENIDTTADAATTAPAAAAKPAISAKPASRTAKASKSGAAKSAPAKPKAAAAAPVDPAEPVTEALKPKARGIPTPVQLVSDALHAVDELRARGEQTLKSAFSRLRR